MEINITSLILTINKYYIEHEELLKYIPRDQFCADTGIKFSVFKPWGGFRKFYTEYTDFKSLRNKRAIALITKQMRAIEEEYGYASMNLYIQLRNRGHLHHSTLVRWFRSLIDVRIAINMEISERCFNWCFDHTEEEYRKYFHTIIDKYGYVSRSLVNHTKGITLKAINNEFGSLKNACEYFNIPYRAEPSNKSQFQCLVEAECYRILGLPYVTEKKWPWFKYKNPLAADIYYFAYDLVIEADGEQHYKKTEHFYKTDDEWETSQMRDQVKDKLLKKHGIKELRVRKRDVKNLPKLLANITKEFEPIKDLCLY